MSKQKNNKPETWGSRMEEWGGGDFTFLSEDGETIIFIVVGLPELMEGVYKNKKQQRVGLPIVSEDGYQLLVAGKRLARRLTKHEKLFKTKAFMVTRIGGEGDVNAKYPIKVLPEKETFDNLCAIKEEDFTPDMIPDSVKEALKILQG